jgi:FMN-dependent NADH-azoreductase
MKILHIDASILGANSASREVSAAIVQRLRQARPGLDVTYRDLAAVPLAHITAAHVAAAMGAAPESLSVQQELADSQAVLREFMEADTVVIGAPMYNFSISSPLKAWIDQIVRRGKTFSYGADGPRGLLEKKKKIVVITARGGAYEDGTPARAYDFQEPYLRHIFGFVGLTDVTFIHTENQMRPEAGASLAAVTAQIGRIVREQNHAGL